MGFVISQKTFFYKSYPPALACFVLEVNINTFSTCTFGGSHANQPPCKFHTEPAIAVANKSAQAAYLPFPTTVDRQEEGKGSFA